MPKQFSAGLVWYKALSIASSGLLLPDTFNTRSSSCYVLGRWSYRQERAVACRLAGAEWIVILPRLMKRNRTLMLCRNFGYVRKTEKLIKRCPPGFRGSCVQELRSLIVVVRKMREDEVSRALTSYLLVPRSFFARTVYFCRTPQQCSRSRRKKLSHG